MYNLKEEYESNIKAKLNAKFNYKNPHLIPKVLKVVLNRGLGADGSNNKVLEQTRNEFMLITGQTPVFTKSKKAVSNFKIKENQVIGCKVTLRGSQMYDFLTKFINIALPKIRDFRGIPKNSFDGRGNYMLGIKDNSIFLELDMDKFDRRGYNICIETSCSNDDESFELLNLMGMPFRKN